jgi:hypothetical protein
MSDISVRAHPRGTREVLADICGGRLGYRGKPSARLDAVAYGAEAGIGVFPRVRARDPDHLQICAAAKAQPLHDRQRGGARRIPGISEDLVTLLAADPQGLGRGDANIPEIWSRREESWRSDQVCDAPCPTPPICDISRVESKSRSAPASCLTLGVAPSPRQSYRIPLSSRGYIFSGRTADPLGTSQRSSQLSDAGPPIRRAR